jgi:hypothetical protein
LKKSLPKTTTELKNNIKKIWNDIDLNVVNRIINTMPKRMEMLKKLNGKKIEF